MNGDSVYLQFNFPFARTRECPVPVITLSNPIYPIIYLKSAEIMLPVGNHGQVRKAHWSFGI